MSVRRWVATIAVGTLAAGLCVTAGVWQWGRHQDRSAQAAVVIAHRDADPTPAAPVAGATIGPDRLWEPVTVRGRYLGEPVLLRNRPVSGQAAFHVLGAVEVTSGPAAGAVLVVARGWVPSGADASGPAVVPTPPGGEVDLVVRLRPQETASTRAAPVGQVQTVHADQIRAAALATGSVTAARWPAEATVAGYAVVVSEDGAAPADLGRLPAPDTDLGSHLSYAFQWWVFAVGALGGSVLLVVRERREAAEPGEPRPASRPRRPTAEEEEDAILDAQGR